MHRLIVLRKISFAVEWWAGPGIVDGLDTCHVRENGYSLAFRVPTLTNHVSPTLVCTALYTGRRSRISDAVVTHTNRQQHLA